MDDNQVEGTARTMGGRIQDAVGGLTGDAATQVRGKINQMAGQAQARFGDAADQARELGDQVAESVRTQPWVALAVTGAVGFALGLLARR